jgi:hypothetical protein
MLSLQKIKIFNKFWYKKMLMLKNKLFVLFILLFISCNLLLAQEKKQRMEEVIKNGEGKEFYLAFMINFNDDANSNSHPLENMVFITSDYNANVKIEFSKEQQSQNLKVRAGEVISVRLNRFSQATLFEMEDVGQAIHITADTQISVYGLNRRKQTTDNYLAFPVEVLGTEYMVMSYYVFSPEMQSTFSIVATENNTIVEITPTIKTSGGKPAGQPFKITLNKGSVYQVGANTAHNSNPKDLTGTYIKANKKIAVYGGHQCATVPYPAVSACNVLCEQLPSLNTWGKNFYIGAFKSRSFYTYRVLASKDSTKVFEDTTLIAVLNKGEFVQRNSRRNIQITADKPVLVAQYSQGSSNGDNIGDPMMILISPTQQYLKKYRFATPVNGEWIHYINVFVPTNAVNSFEINGKSIKTDAFTRFGNTKYSIANISLPYGSHTVKCNVPFGLTSYGFGIQRLGFVAGPDAYDAYGAMGGQSFVDYKPIPDTIPPTAEGIISNSQKSVLVSDDGRDDLGLSDIKILKQDNITLDIPKFTKGAPSVIVAVNPSNLGSPGSAIIMLTDVANNTITFSICYVYDYTSGEFVILVNEGDNAECTSTNAWLIGTFYSHSYNFISSNFNSTGNITTNNTFNGLTGTSGIFGFSLSKHLFSNFNFNGKLNLITNTISLTSPDTNKHFISNTEWQAPYTTETIIYIDNFALGLDLGLDWKFSNYMYFSGGLSFVYNITKTADIYETLALTPGYEFSNGGVRRDIASKLESLSTLNVGLYLGPGINCNISYGFQVFCDLNYYFYPFSILNDADLFMNKLNIKFGVRYQL